MYAIKLVGALSFCSTSLLCSCSAEHFPVPWSLAQLPAACGRFVAAHSTASDVLHYELQNEDHSEDLEAPAIGLEGIPSVQNIGNIWKMYLICTPDDSKWRSGIVPMRASVSERSQPPLLRRFRRTRLEIVSVFLNVELGLSSGLSAPMATDEMTCVVPGDWREEDCIGILPRLFLKNYHAT